MSWRSVSSRKSQRLGRFCSQTFGYDLMLKRRLIPKLQLALRQSFRGAQPVLVVTRKFSNRRAIGDPLSQAKIYEAQLADELFSLTWSARA